VKTGKANEIDLLWKGEDLRIMGESDYPELFIDGESMWVAKYYVGFSEYNMRTRKTNTYYYRGEYSGKNTVYTIRKDAHDKNLYWLGTDNGIYSFNKATKKIERNFYCSNLADSSAADLQINHLDVMNQDTIWFYSTGKRLWMLCNKNRALYHVSFHK
jgi:ligand-binding sensor domain-containing protein